MDGLQAFETHDLGMTAWAVQAKAAQLTGWAQNGAALLRSQYSHDQLRLAWSQSPLFVFDKQLAELRAQSRCARQITKV